MPNRRKSLIEIEADGDKSKGIGYAAIEQIKRAMAQPLVQPTGMTDDQIEIWGHVVHAMPEHYYCAGDSLALMNYCIFAAALVKTNNLISTAAPDEILTLIESAEKLSRRVQSLGHDLGLSPRARAQKGLGNVSPKSDEPGGNRFSGLIGK